ncbi:MAG: ABC-F family ATP-binding cassette domain-containing protein [Eubacteriales bacterium]|nr:ABC-F family ATP-binding cassette domain-containing protein [Eubacteriales bacterium]
MARLFLEATDLRLSFGMKTILNIPSFRIHEGERIGLVGENGAGKTTLLRALAGELEPESGVVRRYRPVSYIRQTGDDDAETFDERIGAVFQAQEKREGLSGGEKTRRRIAAALSSRAHVLLADEPTTDLDADGVAQLRQQLLAYPGALLLVSHDRALLDAVCTSIAELRDGALEIFPGNYAAYRAERERRMEFARFEYDAYRAEQARLRKVIQSKTEQASQVRRAPKRMGNSEARLHKRGATEIVEKIAKERKAIESRLNHLEKKERVREDPEIRMALGGASPVVSKTMLELRGFTMRIGGRALLQNASARVPTGSRTALLGKNGCGKTSLIRRILQGNDPRIRLAPGAKIGYFGQEHAEALELERTALQNAMALSPFSESEARTVLARLGLKENELFKPAQLLSGGEKAKVALARLMLSEVNFLILDEPTNHLDIYTMEALEQLLCGYAGTLLFVSHDERFVSSLAGRLLLFEDGALRTFEGGSEQYRASLQADRAQEDAQLDRSVLEMRMAVLSARLAAPKKGDDPQALNEEYFELARRLRELSKNS